MKVYVCTEAKLFGGEIYMFVKSSKKAAEKALRTISPHMRSTSTNMKNTTCYFTDATNQHMYFIHEEEV